MISMAEITDACNLFTDDTSLDAQLATILPSDAGGAAALLSEAMLDADATRPRCGGCFSSCKPAHSSCDRMPDRECGTTR